ncbi:FIST N-terminal domain-containing protein [Tropicimonas sp. S265A]|uniref:FIST N-terminal domain-containing protein n=1 Tax=Tropicimonas sp. S265A TaxID=3415134 RepID=UPI003C7EACE8
MRQDSDAAPVGGAFPQTILRAHVPVDHPDAVAQLKTDLGDAPFALVVLFVSPDARFRDVIAEARRVFSPAPVLACTTAGEIANRGYTEGEIVAIGLPSDRFAVEAMVVDNLHEVDSQALIDRTIRHRTTLSRSAPDWVHEFAFLLIDGLSLKEDELAFALATGLGTVPMFGGSAGDGERFEETFVSFAGDVYQNAAVLAFVRTRCPVHVFSLDHLKPTEKRMVVTRADPSRRIVHEINTEPAAREYARLLGHNPEDLGSFTFAAHPVVVTIGGNSHVRAIQKVTEDGDLVFFSAIDEGLVLTLAEPDDIVVHLEAEFSALSNPLKPDAILACDCILRRLEAGQLQKLGKVSQVLAENQVVGFSTYGEQLNAMHVNHTMTGVALYPPDSDPPLVGRAHDELADRPKRLA